MLGTEGKMPTPPKTTSGEIREEDVTVERDIIESSDSREARGLGEQGGSESSEHDWPDS